MNTKQKILTTAMHLLKQKGYHNWSYDHISQEVGIKKSSIHYYFPSKDQLVAEVLKIYIKDFFSRLEILSKSNFSNTKKLQELMNIYKMNYENPREICLCTILSSDYEILSSEITEVLQLFYSQLQDWIKNILIEGIKSGEFKKNLDEKPCTQLIMSSLQGHLIIGKISSDHEAFDLCMKQLFLLLKS